MSINKDAKQEENKKQWKSYKRKIMPYNEGTGCQLSTSLRDTNLEYESEKETLME